MHIRWISSWQRIAACLLILVVFLALSAVPASAQGTQQNGDRLVIGQEVVIRSGETVDGSLVVLGGRVTVEAGGRVAQDLVAIGGKAVVDGQVDGTLFVGGGNVELGPTAVVGGDLVVAGGRLAKADGAEIVGSTVDGLDFERLFSQAGRADGPPAAQLQTTVGYQPPDVMSWIWSVFRMVLTMAGLTLLAVLVVLFLPRETHRVAWAMRDAPVASIGIGFLTALVAVFLLPLLALLSTLLLIVCIGLFGYALLTLLVVVLGAAILFGWIAAGLLVGERILHVLRLQQELPVLAAAIGVPVITLLGAVPCLGFVFSLLVGCLGLGAVMLSRGGTQAYPHPTLPPGPLVPV